MVQAFQIWNKGEIINVIKSMYVNIKSRIKYENQLGGQFKCLLRVRQGECLSPFLFSMYVNDLEETFVLQHFKGIEIGMLKLFFCFMPTISLYFQNQKRGYNRG